MPTNFPAGFPGFQAHIEALTEALGGTVMARVEVEIAFDKTLRETIAERIRDKRDRYNISDLDRHFSCWTAATDEDFREAADLAQRYFVGIDSDTEHQRWASPMLKGEVVLRGDGLYLEKNEHRLYLAGSYFDAHASQEIAGRRKARTVWRAFLTDGGERIAKRFNRRPQHASVTCVSGRDAAITVLRRFAETIFVPA